MWEELNRPKADRPRQATVHETAAPTPETLPTEASSGSPADRIDPQHLLLVGAALFVGVTLVALFGLGGSAEDEQAEPAATEATTPDILAAVDETVVEAAPIETTTTEAPQAMAMGLPAALLDSAQSQVFRLYRTALGREPDRDGFEYWSSQVRDGVSLEELANGFLASEEYQEQFADGDRWDDRAEQLLINAFGEPENQAQLQRWRIRFAGLNGAELLLAISESDEALAATGTLR